MGKPGTYEFKADLLGNARIDGSCLERLAGQVVGQFATSGFGKMSLLKSQDGDRNDEMSDEGCEQQRKDETNSMAKTFM